MIPRLLTIWDRIRSSLWALPFAMVLAACALAYAALHIDLRLDGDWGWFLFSGDPGQASQFLSSLVGAMITMATLAVSITMVVLTLAAQQLVQQANDNGGRDNISVILVHVLKPSRAPEGLLARVKNWFK